MAEKFTNKIVDDFHIIWLDNTIEKSSQNRDTKSLIRQMVKGHLRTFDDPNQCVDYIFTQSSTQKIIFIVSNTFGGSVVSFIHDLSQIEKIYVYCGNQQRAESWTKPFSKVAGIFTNKKELLNKICDDVRGCNEEDDLPMSIFHLDEKQKSLQNLTAESATFMWYRSILMVLRLMAKYCNSKTEMIKECRIVYGDNKIEKEKIDEFEKTYNPTKAFWWYTCSSFVYRLLNQALRTQNIEIIFKFRFFINDLHNQIEQFYQQYLRTNSSLYNHQLTLYRGQRLSNDELNSLKSNVNQLISMNSFLSVTTDRLVAEIFADTSDQSNEPSPLQSVLFIINIRDMSKETTPFAFIEQLSCNPDEKEVLFTIGAIFKVESVEKHGTMWHVHLQLSKQQNQLCQELSSHMMKQIGSEPGPLSFGWFLYRMNEFEKAQRYAQFMLEKVPPNDKEIGNVYNLLGLIYKDLNRLEQSVECYEKALDIYSHFCSEDSPQIISTHYNLGLAYLALGDYRRADGHKREAESKLINSSQPNKALVSAMISSLQGKIEVEHGYYRSASENFEVALEDKKKHLPEKHPSIASSLNEIGIVEEKMGNDKKALESFKEAFEIGHESLPSNHLDLAQYRMNLGRIYYKLGEYACALEHFEIALNIFRDITREETETISTLKDYIDKIKRQKK